MRQKPFLPTAVLGNSRLLATLTADGEIQRLFWPHVDGGQQIERLLGGISLNGSPVRWQNDPCWAHSQAYEQDQNILVTTSSNDLLELRSVDTATPGRDLLLRHISVSNRSEAPVAVQYVSFQWIRVDENPLYNTALFDETSDAIVHYRRDVFVAGGSDRPLTDFSIGGPEETLIQASALQFAGGSVLHGDVAAAGLYDLGTIAPGATATLTVFWAFGQDLKQVRSLLAFARSNGADPLLNETRRYWHGWLAAAKPLRVTPSQGERTPLLPGIPAQPASPEQVRELYNRSLLMFKLMSDEQTGAVIAAPEFDPAFTSCGGYAYCWGRDAAYITTAMDLAGYHDLAGAFYRWAVKAQEPEGWWMHRHYASGHWGPSWGLIQVDETGSILFGMALHARLHGRAEFVTSVWGSVTRAADWLLGFIDPETGLTRHAVDLWEERTEQITYSAGAVYAGLVAAAEMAALVGQHDRAGAYREGADRLHAAILRETVHEGYFLRGRYLQVTETDYLEALQQGEPVRQRRGPKGHTIYERVNDPVPDSSLLGMATPFRVVEHDHPVMTKTVERLVNALWMSPAGGMVRYTNDRYRGGKNPWVLCTLWLGLYAAERGDRALGHQMLDWAVARRNAVGLLPEQVDHVTGEPVWVLPLTWSHAMYVLLALELYGDK